MNLGTLWFGADIDLTALRQKIQSGNQSILDALKMNYDPASYQQMVTKLRTELSKETFDIKINTNTAAIKQSLNSTLNSITNSATAPKIDLNGLKGVPGMTRDIVEMRDTIFTLNRAVNTLKQQWRDMARAHGENSRQAQNAKKQYLDANSVLQTMRVNMSGLQRDRSLATLAQSELNKQMREASKTARQWDSDHMRLNATLAGGIHVSTQLGSALSSLFALDAARQFLGQVIEIGGQLEKQRISIGAILGDTVKASHLFEQIKGLALKSPFGVVELDQYTKQLSAYGFKYNELYDMTKRLADISAGAGTDIGRLTLALGHVRSATYLTGITLRQFSMNNIPMLKMLADYYTEVEKKAVSTADVQKRISKRQVSYEDVIEQIRRLTDEGGMFFNMQEKISESLAAKFKNVRDAMDIMYGEIAEGSVGDVLKEVASVLLKTTRHWREIAAVMGVAGSAFLLNKTRIGLNTLALQGNTRATLKQIMATKQIAANNLTAASTYRKLTAQEEISMASSNSLTVADIKQAMAVGQLNKEDVLRLIALKKLKIAQAMHLNGINGITAAEIRAAAAASKWKASLAGIGMSLKNAFMGIGGGTWATLGIMVGTEIYMAYNQWNQRIEDKANEMKDIIKSRIVELEKMQKLINNEEKPKDNVALKNRVDDLKQALANSEAYTKTLDEQLTKSKDLSGQYDILATEIAKVAEKNRQMLDYQDRIASMIKATSGDLASWNIGENMDWFFNDDITQNMSQVLDSYKDLRAVIDGAWEYKDAIKGVIEEMSASGEISSQFAEQLKNAPFEEQIRLLAESGYWKQIKDKVAAMKPDFIDFAEKIKEASNGVTNRWEEIANDDIPRMMRKLAKDRGVSEDELNKWCLENIDDFKMMLDGIADQLDLKEPEIRNRLKRLFYNFVSFGKLAQGNVSQEVWSQTEKDLLNFVGVEDERLKKLLGYDEKADIKDENKTDPSKGDKKDKALEAAKTKLQEYKAFLQEYKKFREIYDKEKAISLLEKLFPNLKDKNGKFLGTELVDNYSDALAKLRDALEPTSEARKKFINEINKTESETLFDREKETLKENADAMKEYTKKMTEQWKLYRTLLGKSGGNKSFADLAFNEGTIWDETAKKMLERFNQRGAELGVIPVGFDWSMNEKQLKETLVDAKGQVQTELVELAKAIQNVTRGNYTKFLEDSADAYSKSLTAAQKLVELEQKREDIIHKRDTDNDQSDAKRQGWNAQVAALDKEIASQRWEAFKETEEWGRIFSNLDDITTSTLQHMLDRLREIAPLIKDDVQSIKALYEAMEKMQDALYSRNPFKALAENLSTVSAFREVAAKFGNFKGAGAGATITLDASTAKRLKLNTGEGSWTGTKSQFFDAMRKEEKGFSKIVGQMGQTFKGLQDVMQPVIDLFDQLGMEGMSDIFGIGSKMFGNAASVAQGFSTLGDLFSEDSGIGKALGNAGPWGAAAGAALGLVEGIFALHDKALQEEIEASEARQKEMENLTKNLETALERALGGVYSTSIGSDTIDRLKKEIINEYKGMNEYIARVFGHDNNSDYKPYLQKDTIDAVKNAEQTKKYYDAAYASLLAQRDELQHQMDSEEDKKNSDADKLADYRQQIIEMEDQISYFYRDMAKNLWDIDVKSWAKELTDTIVDAWKNGENAVDAYHNKVKEMMLDLTTNILSQKVMEKMLEKAQIDNLIEDLMEQTKGELDTDSVAKIAERLFQAGDESANMITAILDKMESRGYISKGDGSGSSATTNGIGKAITEQDTSLWSSYLNAIRADVSVNRTQLATQLPALLSAVQHSSAMADIQVANLQQIAEHTKRNADAADKIYDLLHKLAPDGTKFRVS